jgi:hypothetical protein
MPGCWDLRPVENLSLYLGLAIDLAPNGKDLLITTSALEFTMPRRSDVRVAWVEAADLSQAIGLLQLQEARAAVAGKVIMYLFGEDFYKSGRIVEFARSAYVRSDMSLTGLVACVKGKAGEILAQRPEEQLEPGSYTWALLTSGSSHGSFPRVSLLEVARQRPLNQDMWLVLLEPQNEFRTIRPVGSVVFRKTQPVAELNEADTLDLMWAGGKSIGQTIPIGVRWLEGGTISATITSTGLRSKRKQADDGSLIIEAETRCRVQMHYPHDLSKAVKEQEDQRVSEISTELTGRGMRLIRKLQELDSDPLGLTKPGPFTNAAEAKSIRDAYRSAQIIYRARAAIEVVGGQ